MKTFNHRKKAFQDDKNSIGSCKVLQLLQISALASAAPLQLTDLIEPVKLVSSQVILNSKFSSTVRCLNSFLLSCPILSWLSRMYLACSTSWLLG